MDMVDCFTTGGSMHAGQSVGISRAENGYMVVLKPDMDPFAYGHLGRMVEPHQVDAMKEQHEKTRPRIFIFADIDDAWIAVKEFLLDGRIPKGKS